MRTLLVAPLLALSLICEPATTQQVCEPIWLKKDAIDVPLTNGFGVEGTFTYLGMLPGDCETPCRFFFEVISEIDLPFEAGPATFIIYVNGWPVPITLPQTNPTPPPYHYVYSQSFPGYEVKCGSEIELTLTVNPATYGLPIAWSKMRCEGNC